MQSSDTIYQDHGQKVYQFLLGLCQQPDLAEELTQETFYQALKRLDQFRGQSSVTTWLCAIAKNLYYQHVRKHQDMVELNDQLVNKELAWDDVSIIKRIYQLENPGKEIVYLRLISNLTFRQIGEIMGQSENWVRVNFFRAKQKIGEGSHEDE